ncbi:MAG: hypothetical protein ACP5IX_00435 [Patescibacteria group bacterium]
MKKVLGKIVLILAIVAFLLSIAIMVLNKKAPLPQEQIALKNCLESGGQVVSASCCLNTSNFPDTCLIGACGCAPDKSHIVQICDCGPNKCFDGKTCVNR